MLPKRLCAGCVQVVNSVELLNGLQQVEYLHSHKIIDYLEPSAFRATGV